MKKMSRDTLLRYIFMTTSILGILAVILLSPSVWFYLSIIPLLIIAIHSYRTDSFSKNLCLLIIIVFIMVTSGPLYYLSVLSQHCTHEDSFSVNSNNEVSVIVGWCEEEIVEKIEVDDSAIAFSLIKDDQIGAFEYKRLVYIVDEDYISQKVIMHELGHTMGLKHEEETIMSPNIDGIDNEKGPDKKALKIARKFDNYRIINWNNEKDYKFLEQEYRNGNLSKIGFSWATNRYRNSSGYDIYYKSNFNGFGGISERISNRTEDRFYTLES